MRELTSAEWQEKEDRPSSPLAALGVLLPAGAGRTSGAGFTLIEVILAIALTMVIAGAAMSLATTLLERRDQINDAAVRDRGVAILMDQVEQDLMGVVAGGNGGSGFVGTSHEVTLRVRGVTLRHEDLIEARYRFVTSGDGALKPGRVIARRGVSGTEETLADGVALMRLRYHDGVSWVASYDSSSKRELPWAVEIAVWLGDPAEFADDAAGGGVDGDVMDNGDARDRDEGASVGGDLGADVIVRPPDRVRVILVPDGVGPMGTGEAIGGGA